MPIMLLHLFNSLLVFTSAGCPEIAFCCIIKLIASGTLAAELDRLIVLLLFILLHDHFVVCVVVEILVVHYKTLLDRLLKRRVSQMIDYTSMQWSVPNPLICLQGISLFFIILLIVEFDFRASNCWIH